MLIVIELVEVLHAELDLSRKIGKNPTLILLLIRPISSCQYLDTDLKRELLGQLCSPEVIHSVLAHLDVFEHYLKLLCELKPAFLL